MESIKCAVFDAELARELGKRESESDLEFYHRTFEGKRLTFVYPKGFPDKVNPLMQALYLSDFVLLNVAQVDAQFGEIVVAVDAMGKDKGFVVLGEGVDEEQVNAILKGTSAEGFGRVKKDEVLGLLANAELKGKEGNTIVDLDSMFVVKSVGTVALGFVAQGEVKKFAKLRAIPSGEEVLVKSMQKHDKDVNDAQCGDRVGLSLKGIEVKSFSRGLVLAEEDEFEGVKEITVEFEKSRFWKGEVAEGAQLHMQCRLQVVGCKVKSVSPLVLELGKEIAVRAGERVLLADVNAKPRVVGSGILK